MALTKKQLAARKEVTASFVPALMAGDKDKIMSEWRRAVGDPTWKEEDLSMVWPVQLGSYLEKFVLDWHAKKTHATLTHRGKVVVHPTLLYISCTIDAFRPSDNTVIDCKVVGAWRKIDEVIRYYTPQLIVQRKCIDAGRTSLLIVHGGAEPVEYPVEYTTDYENEVFRRIEQFWQCVESLTPPFDMEPALAPVAAIKEYDFADSNEWCNQAGIWLENREASKKFEAAAKEIKATTPADAQKAKGGGIIVTRNKAGSLTIKDEQS